MKHSILVTFLFLIVSFNSFTAVSQQTTSFIKAQVKDEKGVALSGATISLNSTKNQELLKTTTDSSGNFILYTSVNDSVYILISHTGYHSFRSSNFSMADVDLGIIILQSSENALEEIVVESTQKTIEVDAGTITYNVSKSIDAQGQNALEALRKAPGVFVSGDNAISLNGRSGVLILLDGRQTYLSNQELADLLKSMPASGIKSFEIISNPTAKYDASGSAGIINIKTLKSTILGFTGSATTGVSYGVSVKTNQEISANFRKNNFNFYGSYNHVIGHYNYIYGSDRTQNTKTYNSATDDTDKRNRLGGRIGFDYNLNKRNTIGILLNANFILGGGITRTRTDISNAGSSFVDEILYSENDYYFQRTERYNANINYKYEDEKGRMINADLDYGEFTKGNRNLQSNIYTDNLSNIQSERYYRSLSGIDMKLKAFKLDYTMPVWKGIFETGIKYSTIGSGNEAQFYHVLANTDSLDNRRSSNFTFAEQIASAYINYKKTLGIWSLQAGLRYEHTGSESNLLFIHAGKDSLERMFRDYHNFFPSFSISVKPSEPHSISLSYSRRIDRPAYQDLNPFVFLLDELSFWQGNPFLQPQLPHRASLQYVFRSSTIIGFNYSYTDQFSTRITDTVESIKFVMIPKNLGTQQTISVNFTQNIKLKPWWEITFNGTFYQLRNRIAFDSYRKFNLNQKAARVNLQQRFKLPYGIGAELTGYFTSQRLTGANEISRGVSQVDLAFQKTVLKNKGVLRIAINDIYKGNQFKGRQSFEGFELNNYGYYESRQIRVNFTYKFAEGNIKAPRTRTSALENENKRIN